MLKQVLYKATAKSQKNTNKRPGIEFALFNGTGEMRMDNVSYENSSLYFISTL